MSFDARAIIAQVRGGVTPSSAALSWFANGLADGQISEFTIQPADIGLDEVSLDALLGGTPAQNAAHLRALLMTLRPGGADGASLPDPPSPRLELTTT